jgi:PhnB protein
MTSAVPQGMHSITPALVVTPCADAIAFYERAFDAEEVEPRMTGPDGTVAHADVRIAGSIVMLGDEWPDGPTQSPRTLGGSTSAVFIYHDEIERLWDQAVEAGAEVVFPLEMQFYGDLAGRLRDPFGHTWGLARHVEDVAPDEMERRMASFYESTD